MKTVHLVCNAHLDPVWQWPWEEGAAEAVSTFRVAADFCEEFSGFVFCHNEVILYEWIEEYEPQLFKHIQKLVKENKWHIMGGWYLQPDCNMPSGESFVRQILLGREYFQKKFGKRPTTAINFDPFGHSRGLVQIMAKSGFDSYLFCRPNNQDCPLPNDLFVWEGYDGSCVTGLRNGCYNSHKGYADQKIKDFIASDYRNDTGLLLWGIGNHGGGPSHEDLVKIGKLIRDTPNVKIIHSIPEAFFKQVKREEKNLPVVSKSLNAWAVGCYTSQVRIKQLNRQLENQLFVAEKMLTSAWKQGVLAKYPTAELNGVMRDMAFLQFHDILPGSSVEEVEETSLRLANHALEKLSRLKARAFFSLATGQKKASNGDIPILVYNPHPFAIKATIECEYQLEDMKSLKDGFHIGIVCKSGKKLPTQMEKEASSLELDWRKKVIFNATLEPSQMNRFDCKLVKVKERPTPKIKPQNGLIRVKTNEVDIVINTKTGLMDKFHVAGKDMLAKSAFLPLVIDDNEDPWGMLSDRFRKVVGKFKLLSAEKSAEFSGLTAVKKFPPVRVIEDGAIRTVIEAVFGYNDSFICQHYILPKQGTEVGVTTRVIWGEKNRMLKLDIPVAIKGVLKIFGQVAYGVEELPADDRELVAQKWSAVAGDADALTLINDGVYGFDFVKGSLRPTLLRSAAYCAHPIDKLQIIPQDRFLPRIDTGQRVFKFVMNGGPAAERLNKIDREALVHAEKPMAFSFFPCGMGKKNGKFVTLSDEVVQLAAMKKAQKGDGVIIRLFNPTDKPQKTTLSIPTMNINKKLTLTPFEIKSFKADKSGKLAEVTLDEKLLLERV